MKQSVEHNGKRFCQQCWFEVRPTPTGLVHVGTGKEECSKPASVRKIVTNRVYSVSGLTYCSICSGEVEMYDTEEGFVHKGTRTPICSPPKLQYHAPLRDYIVPTESLRDRMAMAALTGLLASFDFIPRSTPPEHVSSMAKFSYLMADAMLEERVREKTTEGRDQSGLAGSGVRVPIWPSSAETSGGEGDIASKPCPVGRRPPEHD